MTETVALPALPAPPEPPLPPWPGQPVTVGGRTLFVRRAGRAGAHPVVLIHGLGGASTNWTDLMFLLSPDYDCWAPDLPGFGRSGPPPGSDYSLDSHVRAATRLIEEVVDTCGRPVHLFGNSLGGALTTRIAATRPDLVRTLTLVSPALPVLDPRLAPDYRLLLLLVPGAARIALWATSRQTATDRMAAVADLCLADPCSMPQQRVDETVAELERRRGLPWFDVALMSSMRGLVRSYFARGQGNLWLQAAHVTVPTLVMWGRHDKLVSVRIAPRVHRAFAGSRLVVLDNCGHVAQMEDPVRVAEEFRAMVLE